MKKGLIQIYTGDGKGKTTAAVGQIIRALGYDFKIIYINFFKNPKRFEYGELEILKKLNIPVFNFAPKHPHFYKNEKFENIRNECKRALEFINKIFEEKKCDILVLDEINIAIRDGFLNEDEVINLLKNKPQSIEVILTGRGATNKLIEIADLVTEVKKIKHHYDKGIKRRKGIEY